VRVSSIRSVLLSHRCVGEPLVWVGGRIESWDAALVEVVLEDGTTGLGEVGQGIMAAVAVPGLVEALAPFVVGADLAPGEVGDRLRAMSRFWGHGGITSGAIGAIETAWYDAAAKREGVPLWRYLGADPPPTVAVYASGGLGVRPEEVSAWVAAQVGAGFPLVKIRAMRDPATTIALAERIAGELPPGVGFALDAVQACASRPWGTEAAIGVGAALARLGAAWFEEPCAVEDVAGYAAVRAAVGVDVSGIESYTLVEQFDRLLAAGGVDFVQPDLTMVGGPTAFRRVVERAAEDGVRFVPHVWGSAVQLGASVHCALAAGAELIELCTIENPLRDALLVRPPAVVDGRMARPEAPGIGAVLTPETEAAHPFLKGLGHVIA
jgi:L-alanine-DL-glutamate epimerase-like enolase superfamily enzyme